MGRLTDLSDDIKKVEEAVIAVGLNSETGIGFNTLISSLESAERLDLLDIYDKAGMNFADYTSGGRLNQKYTQLLSDMTKHVGEVEAKARFETLSKLTKVTQFFDIVTVGDLAQIRAYERGMKTTGQA